MVYVGQHGDRLSEIVRNQDSIDELHAILAGKFRRYHGRGVIDHLLDVKTMLFNLRDVFFVGVGFLQSLYLLLRLRPAAIFIKGGYVGVPVGLAAALLRVPIVTHDSDAMPGLANRIVSRWAARHAVGMPKEFYAYNPKKTAYVGVPVNTHFRPAGPALQAQYRAELDLPKDALVLLVTGGSLGAQRLNEAIRHNAEDMLRTLPKLHLVLITGRRHEPNELAYYHKLPQALQSRVHIRGYVSDLYRYTGAADLIVTRAGATTIAELSLQRKPCIVVPNPELTGGHQLKNAEELAADSLVEVVHEDAIKKEPTILAAKIVALLRSPANRQQLASRLATIAKPKAATELAQLIIFVAEGRHKLKGEADEKPAT